MRRSIHLIEETKNNQPDLYTYNYIGEVWEQFEENKG